MLDAAEGVVHPAATQRADGSLSDPTLSNFIPVDRDRSLHQGAKVPLRPNPLQPPQGKPALQRVVPGLPPLSPATGSSDEAILNRLRMLAAVDESVGEILAALTARGTLDRTVVVFTSDQGYWYGEHGLSVERRLAYEEGIRVPLLLRYPPSVKAGTKRDAMVLTLDFAPTLLEFAGLPAPEGLHGRSFVPLLADPRRELRRSFLIEHFSDTVFPRSAGLGYQAIRTEDWKYIRYAEIPGANELYDLNRDPYEMRNLVNQPAAAEELVRLKAELTAQLAAIGAPVSR
ncbi:MAG: sulfatase-like hydrolase/transferase [Opitutaceae bacterium]|nr:sulfatase-like hydrolase/transferase [Opitutaceae bacterium]